MNILVRRSTAGRADVRSRARGVARRGRRCVSGRLARGDRGVTVCAYGNIRTFGARWRRASSPFAVLECVSNADDGKIKNDRARAVAPRRSASPRHTRATPHPTPDGGRRRARGLDPDPRRRSARGVRGVSTRRPAARGRAGGRRRTVGVARRRPRAAARVGVRGFRRRHVERRVADRAQGVRALAPWRRKTARTP